MSDVRSYSKEFITEFINLYQSLPCLWNIKSKDYADRNKKNGAYEKMVEKLKEVSDNSIVLHRILLFVFIGFILFIKFKG